jgi:glycosyltransferase involved in cell wall biosynthesis
MKPLVTVVIPAYNQGQYLAEAVRSVLAQTLQPVEIIVVDDGSTDATSEVAATFSDRIVYIRQTNQGLAAARNTGIKAAQADLIKLLDSDDALYPTSLQLGWEAANLNPWAAVFTASWDDVDAGGRYNAHCDTPPLPEDAFHALFDCVFVGPPSRYFVRRSAFDLVGVFDSDVPGCEAWDLWFRMAAAGLRFMAVPNACVRYRNHASSMSKNIFLMWRSGATALNRAARHHDDCAQCRRARRYGMSRWRQWCYSSMLAPQLREYCRERRYYMAARRAVAALAYDPWITPLILRSARSRLRRT